MNGETQESNDCKQPSSSEAARTSRARLACDETKSNATEGVRRPGYRTSQKTHKRLKAELQGHTSRRHCERAEQRLARRREQEPPNRELKHFKVKRFI